MCVCLLPLSTANAQTYAPDFWCAGQVEGYLGQGHSHQVKKCNEEVLKKPEVILVKFHIEGDSEEDRHSDLDGAAQRSRQQDHLLSLRSGHAFDTIYEWSGYNAGCFQSICGFFSIIYHRLHAFVFFSI